MNLEYFVVLVRFCVVIAAFTIFTSLFYGAVAAGLARWAFGFGEESALMWFGLPVFIICIPFCISFLPKTLRKAGML